MSDVGNGWVVVTGANRGIGQATALALATRGSKLALVGRAAAELESTRRAALDAGAKDARVFTADFERAEDVEALGQQLVHELISIGVLVNNAGIVGRAPVGEMSRELWQRQIAVNLTAPFLLTRAVVRPMLAASAGRILHIGSISSTLGTARHSAYNASKWGLVGFMKSLAEELSDSGVMTLAILPGSVDTSMLSGSGFAPRMSADDVSKTIVYFALDAPLAHNGAVIEMFGT